MEIGWMGIEGNGLVQVGYCFDKATGIAQRYPAKCIEIIYGADSGSDRDIYGHTKSSTASALLPLMR